MKLGMYVSRRTVRAYWPPEPERRGNRRTSSQNWRTLVRKHARSMVACDFLVVVTARLRTLHAFLLTEVGTRRIAHCKVIAHPTAAWTLQQLREAIPSDHSCRFLIRDRDAIFSTAPVRQRCIYTYTKVKRMVCLSDRSACKAGRNYCTTPGVVSETKPAWHYRPNPLRAYCGKVLILRFDFRRL